MHQHDPRGTLVRKKQKGGIFIRRLTLTGDGGEARSQVLLTCVPDFCRFSWEQKGHIDRSRGQIRRQIAALASFPWWQALTVASPADLSGYRCLISPAQGSG